MCLSLREKTLPVHSPAATYTQSSQCSRPPREGDGERGGEREVEIEEEREMEKVSSTNMLGKQSHPDCYYGFPLK